MGASETSLVRESLSKYCKGYGVDLGFGGDKILPSAIGVDLPHPYTRLGEDPVQLGGDARDLYWFKDNVLAYLYSSHLLEDFENTSEVLKEWIRVLKVDGYLVLYLPDEQVYRAHCKATGQPHNDGHKLAHFNLDHVIKSVEATGYKMKLVHSTGIINNYSFEVVFQKL